MTGFDIITNDGRRIHWPGMPEISDANGERLYLGSRIDGGECYRCAGSGIAGLGPNIGEPCEDCGGVGRVYGRIIRFTEPDESHWGVEVLWDGEQEPERFPALPYIYMDEGRVRCDDIAKAMGPEPAREGGRR